MLTCQEVVEYLMSYLNSELAPDEIFVFEKHLAVCPECVTFLETYKQTIRIGQMAFDSVESQSPESQSEEPLPEPLVQAILAAQRRNVQ